MLPITPPATEADPEADRILATALHVLSTEATALSYLSRLYATDPISRGGFVKAVEAIVTANLNEGKTIIIGVGKSGKIGKKLVATMNSLGLSASFMHPVEALHGDLGMVKPVSSNRSISVISYFIFSSPCSVASCYAGMAQVIIGFIIPSPRFPWAFHPVSCFVVTLVSRSCGTKIHAVNVYRSCLLPVLRPETSL